MKNTVKKVFAFDLDGTLTEYRTWITDENLASLDLLKREGFKIVIVGAGRAKRIFTQLREYPVDIIGNYGLQYAKYNDSIGGIDFVHDIELPVNRELVSERIEHLRKTLGYENIAGDSVDFHKSGCITFPLLGTRAQIADKLVFDPDRAKRRAIYQDVANAFPEYSVFVGGSSSFDMTPKPYNKLYALDMFCREEGYTHEEITYFGDDYGTAGNDEVVYESDIDFVEVDKFYNIPKIISDYLEKI